MVKRLVLHGPRPPPPPSCDSHVAQLPSDLDSTDTATTSKQVHFAGMADVRSPDGNITVKMPVKGVLYDSDDEANDENDDDDDSPLSDLEQIVEEAEASRKNSAASISNNGPFGNKGKAPARNGQGDGDDEMLEAVSISDAADALLTAIDMTPQDDENIDEGEIDYYEKTDREDSSNVGLTDNDEHDANSVISLSSDDDDKPEPPPFGMSEKPWVHMNHDMRYQWETMYAQVEPRPLGEQFGQLSFELTEEYQREMDKEMLL